MINIEHQQEELSVCTSQFMYTSNYLWLSPVHAKWAKGCSNAMLTHIDPLLAFKSPKKIFTKFLHHK